MKKIMYLLSILFFTNSIYSETISPISKPCSCVNSLVRMSTSFMDLSLRSYEEASPLYHSLCHEACQALDIHREVVVKQLPDTKAWIPIAAFAQVNAIVINEPVLNTRTYGCKRFTVFHEIVHLKYVDYSINLLSQLAAFSGYFLVKHITNNYGPAMTKQLSSYISGFLNVPFALVAAGMAGNFLSKKAEGRADYQAAYAGNCYQCLYDEIHRRIKTIESDDVTNLSLMIQKKLLLTGGYLSLMN